MDSPRLRRKDLTQKERIDTYCKLLAELKDGKLPHGSINKVARQTGLGRKAVSRVWTRARELTSQGLCISPAVKSLKCQRIYPRKFDPAECAKQLSSLPLSQRTTIRDAAKSLGISKTTLHRIMKEEDSPIRCHTSSLKPTLTDENKLSRVMFALSKINDNGLFHDLYDEVHLDEKWFYMTTDGVRYILSEDEDDPKRYTRHKNHIEKVMFLAAVARPRYDYGKRKMFDGKIGIWPVGYLTPAQRNSRNRPAGTMVWKNISLDTQVYRQLLIEKVLPAIKEKFPAGDQRKGITLQQDNAPSHVKPDDAVVAAKIAELQLNMRIINQPANSPDTNINDLAFFRSLQTMQLKDPSSTCEELIEAVQKAFADYKWRDLNKAFLTLQCCFNDILDVDGDNCYHITHMSKDKLERQGLLPVSIRATSQYTKWK